MSRSGDARIHVIPVTRWGFEVPMMARRLRNTCQTRNRARLSEGSEILGQTYNNEALREQ